MTPHGALAREVLGIPKRRPTCRLLVAESVGPPTAGNRVDDLGDPIFALQILRYASVVDDGWIELLELALLLQNAAGVGALGGEVPGRSAGGDLRTNVGDTGGRVLLDGNAELLLNHAEPGFPLCLLESPAPRGNSDALLGDAFPWMEHCDGGKERRARDNEPMHGLPLHLPPVDPGLKLCRSSPHSSTASQGNQAVARKPTRHGARGKARISRWFDQACPPPLICPAHQEQAPQSRNAAPGTLDDGSAFCAQRIRGPGSKRAGRA